MSPACWCRVANPIRYGVIYDRCVSVDKLDAFGLGECKIAYIRS